MNPSVPFSFILFSVPGPNDMPNLLQQIQPIEKWILQYEEKGTSDENRIVESATHAFLSKKEALDWIQPIMESRDTITVSLKRVRTDQSFSDGEDRNRNVNAQIDKSIDLDAIELEDIDLDDIPLDDIMMTEMQAGRLDWHEACCSFLKHIMTPKKKDGLLVDFPANRDKSPTGGSPTKNFFLRRGESCTS